MCFAAVRDRKRLRPIFQRVKGTGSCRFTSARNGGLLGRILTHFGAFAAVFGEIPHITAWSRFARSRRRFDVVYSCERKNKITDEKRKRASGWRTSIGWVYLAVVIDLYNRDIVGYEISKQIDSELVKRALANALDKGIKPELFHSDRGSQYRSESFRRMLSVNKFQK